MAEKEIPRARVVARHDLTQDLMKLWLEPPAEFKGFHPGQYCTIGVDGIERPYSIVSAPHEEHIELFLELIPDMFRTPASLTPKLWELHEGDFVTMRPKAKGTFLLDQTPYLLHTMIATVTGVAPFVSMLRAMRNGYYPSLEPSAWFYIFQGASYCNEFGYDEELQTMMGDNYDKTKKNPHPIVYIPTVSRPDEILNKSWKKQTGRVNLIVEKYFYDFDIYALDAKVYLCGNQGMVDYLGNEKPSAGKPPGKLIAAGYSVKQEVFF